MYRGYPIEQLAEKSNYLEVCYLLLYGELPTSRAADGFRRRASPGTPCCTSRCTFLSRLPARRAPDGDRLRRGRRDGGILPRLDRHQRSEQREIASIRMIAKIPTIVAMAYKYSVGQPFVYPRNDLDYASQFPAHVLFGAGRGICGEPGRRPGDGPDLHAACRPRAERLDLDGAACRLVRRQSLRLHRGGRCLPLGPGAWRRQRGGAQHAQADRHARPHPRVHRQGQGQELRLPPDGLRPPRLQELRSARRR